MKKSLKVFVEKETQNIVFDILTNFKIEFFELDKIDQIKKNFYNNIILLNNFNENQIKFEDIKFECLLISNKNVIEDTKVFNNKITFLKTPLTPQQLENSINIYISNKIIEIEDIILRDKKIINSKTNKISLLTDIENEILVYLFSNKSCIKNDIKENILNIKTNLETNSLESHLTRIRKKLENVNTKIKILSRNDKLFAVFN